MTRLEAAKLLGCHESQIVSLLEVSNGTGFAVVHYLEEGHEVSAMFVCRHSSEWVREQCPKYLSEGMWAA